MSGGGTNTVTQSSQPPAQFLNAYQNAITASQNAAAQPFQTPQAPVAPLNSFQYAGINQAANASSATPGYNQEAGDYLQNSQNPLLPTYSPYAAGATGLYGEAASTIAPQQFSAGNINQYESPYTQQVLGTTEAAEANTDAQQQQQVNSNSVSEGAWGGDRSAVANALTAGQQAIANNATNAGIENAGYTQALGEFNTEQQAGLSSELAAAQGISGVGATALGAQEAQGYLASQGAYGAENLGNLSESEQLEQANANLGSGSLLQGQNQAQLNAPYEEQLAQLAYPFQTAQYEANIAEGVGSEAGGTSATTSPGPSTASELTGLGIAGIGTAGLLSETGLGSLIGGLFARGGGIHFVPRRASGGMMGEMGGGMTSGIAGMSAMGGGGTGASPQIPGQSAATSGSIPGIVNIVPPTTAGHGSGPPHAPNPQQQTSATQELQQGIGALGGKGMQGLFGSPTQTPTQQIGAESIDPAQQGDAGLAGGTWDEGEASGGAISMPHAPRGPKLGPSMGIGAASHPFGMKHLDAGGIVAYPSQTSQEVNAINASTDQANALTTAQASMANPAMAAAALPPIQSSARGGGIAALADGGGVDDGGGWDDPQSAPVTVQGAGPSQPSPDAGSDRFDTGVQTAVSPRSSGSIGGQDASDGWKTMIAMGLGIAGGNSPHALENVGKGGLQGLQFGENMKEREATEGLRATEAQSNAEYKRALIPIRQQGADTSNQRAQWLHEDAIQRMNLQHDDRAAQLQVATLRALNAAAGEGAGRWSYAGTDPNGMPILLNGKTGETKVGNTAIGMKPGEAARIGQGQQRIDALDDYRDYLKTNKTQTLADQEANHRYLESQGATAEDIKMIELSKNPVTGVPTMTPEQAHTQGEQLRNANRQMPAAGGTAAIPGAAPQAWRYTAAGQQGGQMIHSNDGRNWFTSDGKPFGAQ